jgi:hypothetical protein
MERELSPTAIQNALNGIQNKRKRLQEQAQNGFHDVLGGSDKWRGEFTFVLTDARTGDVDRRVSLNTTVDEGENALLQYVGGIADSQTVTFSGDGSKTQFDIPHPYHPIREVTDVTVGGTSQSVPADYAVNYFDGVLYFDSAPTSGTDNVAVDLSYYGYPWEWLAVGTDGTSVSDSQTNLLAEDTRIGLDSGFYTRDESAVEITGQWSFGTGQANVSIAEAGLFNVPPTAAVDGDMLNRTVVSPTIDKTSSQELQVTWTLSMT